MVWCGLRMLKPSGVLSILGVRGKCARKNPMRLNLILGMNQTIGLMTLHSTVLKSNVLMTMGNFLSRFKHRKMVKSIFCVILYRIMWEVFVLLFNNFHLQPIGRNLELDEGEWGKWWGWTEKCRHTHHYSGAQLAIYNNKNAENFIGSKVDSRGGVTLRMICSDGIHHQVDIGPHEAK